jgi:hypothetical protein
MKDIKIGKINLRIPEKLVWIYRGSDFYNKKLLKTWSSDNNPHLLKEKIIIELQEKLDYEVFIETGTLQGEMVYKLNNYFKKLYTIELNRNLFLSAKKRLKQFSKIKVLFGDSGKILPIVLNEISTPCIFWLDSHFSGGETAKSEKDTPIIEELNEILAHKSDHIILIDDARLFGDKDFPDYPSIETVEKLIISKRPLYRIELKNDIICAYPS